MSYNVNVYFIYFLPALMLAYQLTPKKFRWFTLLGGSAVFFWLISHELIVWCIAAALICWAAGLWMEHFQKKAVDRKSRKKMKKASGRVCFAAGFLIVAALAYLKYTPFVLNNYAAITHHEITIPKLIAPIGISFYSLQAISYLLDVHWGRIKAEHNPLKVMLYLMFFATVMEGPMGRWEDEADTLFAGNPITGLSITTGGVRILWGLFKRMVISDRMNTLVNELFSVHAEYTGMMVIFSAVVVTVQLYLEFSGTIDIVIGSAQLFGVKLPENFRQPFLARNAAEFWRRWHISLGTWFKNYIFFPVSTSKLMKKWGRFGRKHCGKYLTNVVTSAIALLPVWLLNGLWHGGEWPYIMYGVYYFVILLLEVMLKPVQDKLLEQLHWSENAAGFVWFCRVRTWIIICLGETLFRCSTLAQFGHMMKELFTTPFISGFLANVMDLNLDLGDYIVILAGIIIVAIVDLRMEKDPDLLTNVPQLSTPRRWAIYYSLIIAIALLGAYGAGYDPVDLIYAGF